MPPRALATRLDNSEADSVVVGWAYTAVAQGKAMMAAEATLKCIVSTLEKGEGRRKERKEGKSDRCKITIERKVRVLGLQLMRIKVNRQDLLQVI